LVESLKLRTWKESECPENEKARIDTHWPKLAIGVWDQDDAGANTNESYKLSVMDAIYGGTALPPETKTSLSESFASLIVDLGDGVPEDEVTMGSETGSFATQKQNSPEAT